jgi:hypothetical protein
MCCSVRIPYCLEWSLHLPYGDTSVYAGLSQNQRRELKKAARRRDKRPGPR